MEQATLHHKGDRVSWKGANGVEFGIITEDMGRGRYMVRLNNGRDMIVNIKSIIE